MSLKLITAPASEPIALAEAKAHLRVDVSDDDALISALIVAARQGAEHITGRALMPQTWELALDGFKSEIYLQKPPLVSVTSVTYVDTAGVVQTLGSSAYIVDDYSAPARMAPSYGSCWPTTRLQANAVTIRYDAGYANAAAVPQQIKQWMLLQVGAMYENRSSVETVGSIVEMPFADRLLDAYRVWSM